MENGCCGCVQWPQVSVGGCGCARQPLGFALLSSAAAWGCRAHSQLECSGHSFPEGVSLLSALHYRGFLAPFSRLTSEALHV